MSASSIAAPATPRCPPVWRHKVQSPEEQRLEPAGLRFLPSAPRRCCCVRSWASRRAVGPGRREGPKANGVGRRGSERKGPRRQANEHRDDAKFSPRSGSGTDTSQRFWGLKVTSDLRQIDGKCKKRRYKNILDAQTISLSGLSAS